MMLVKVLSQTLCELKHVFRVTLVNLRVAFLSMLRSFTATSSRQSDLNAYLQMCSDVERYPADLRPSLFWEELRGEFKAHLLVDGIGGFKSRYFGRRLAAYKPEDRRVFESYVWQYYSSLQAEGGDDLLSKLEEPELGNADVVKIDNRYYSPDLLQSVDEFRTITKGLESFPTGWRSLLEVGAGYGRLAWVFQKICPGQTYIIVDLPECLVLSQYYLSREFPSARLLLYQESRQLDRISADHLEDFDMVFLQPWQMALLDDGCVDGFVNIYSFMEMSREAISSYLKVADRITRKCVYLKQHYLEVNRVDGIEVGVEDYSVPGDWECVMHRTSRLYQHVFERLLLRPRERSQTSSERSSA